MRAALLVAMSWLGALATAQEPIRLHPLFGDHMVLPQRTSVLVRGFAARDTELIVTVPWSDDPIPSRTDASGSFAVAVATPGAGGPFALQLRCGTAERTLHDVLVGDVWLGSGQSNMEMTVAPVGGWQTGVQNWEQEVARAEDRWLRLFTVAQRIAGEPTRELQGEWRVCTPESVAGFSATAYFFGRDLRAARKQPIGLVVSSWGGTVCEAWTDEAGLKAFPEFHGSIAAAKAAVADRRSYAERAAGYWQAIAERDPRDAGRRPEDPAFDDRAWPTVAMPHRWSKADLGGFDGIGWYRVRVDVPQAWAGQDLVLSLGAIDDMDTVWFQGERIDGREEPGHWHEARRYMVPGRLVRGGSAVLAVRVLDTAGEGGFTADAETLRLTPVAGDAGGIGLATAWRFWQGTACAGLPAAPSMPNQNPNVPTVLWNGMIAPLLPFPFRGVLWYQGESNRERAEQYGRLFPAMIQAWRAAIGTPLPFYFVQIAPFGYGGDSGQLFDLRKAQEQALGLPETGMAVTTDVGDPRDIHPRNKQAVGQRLARAALRQTYGDATLLGAPFPLQAKAEGGAVRVRFGNAATALRAGEGGPRHFELQGADAHWVAATARIEGDSVVLAAPGVAAPIGVRYCYAATAVADLWNGDGLPPAPFAVAVPR